MVGAMRRYGSAAVDNNTIMRILIPVGAPIDFGPNPPPEGDRLGNNWSFASADLSKVRDDVLVIITVICVASSGYSS